ncbi:MAG: hypothetical protein ABIW80_15845 [Lapillicoccus sp.]
MTRQRFSRGAALAVLASVAAVGLGVALPESAQAACSGVNAPRVRYWCNATSPSTAYTNNVLGVKHYNEFFVGGSTYPVGIYALTSSGAKLANATVNGTNYVYKTFPGATVRAYCWNRSTSITFSGRCDYIYGY